MSRRSREKAYGDPTPPVRFALRVPPAVWESLCAKAELHGRSRNSEVLEALKAHGKKKA
jgi:predicted HicB family RNase H-like nuclease